MRLRNLVDDRDKPGHDEKGNRLTRQPTALASAQVTFGVL